MYRVLIFSSLLFLITPGRFEDLMLIRIGHTSIPLYMILLVLFVWKNLTKNRALIGWIFAMLMLIMCIIDDDIEIEKLLWFAQMGLVLNVFYRKKIITYKNILVLDTVMCLIGIQLIFQYIGLYTVDYEDQTDVIRYHTTAGDSNISGLLLALFFVLRSTIQDKLIIYMYLVLLIVFAGVIISGSRGALILLLVPLLREFSFKRWLMVVLVITLSLLLSDVLIVDRIVSSFSSGDILTGRLYRVVKSLNELSSIGFFGKTFGIVPLHFTDIKFSLSPHNTYLGFLLQGGIFGALTLLIFSVKFYRLLKDSRGGVMLFIMIVLINFNTELYWLNPYFISTVFVMISILVEYEKNIGSGRFSFE
jgi:hypothetical protein